MIVYGDTSWWIAYKCSDDANHPKAIQLFELWPKAQLVWTPWHRVEVFNSLRQLERAGLVAAGKAREIIRLLEQEVRLGYWLHRECDWRDAVRAACELSAEHGLSIAIRSMDLFHLANALETGADALATFDREQEAFAEAAGLRVLPLLVGRSR